MNDEKLSVWIRIGNAIPGGFDFLELIFYGIPLGLLTFLLGILIAPFILFFEIVSYIFSRKNE